MSVADSFYLNKRDQAKLRDELATISGLVENLSVTITRQARIQKANLGRPKRQRPGPRPPVHFGAWTAADDLHNALTTWVRLVCEQRCIYYRESNDMLTLARWLRKNMVALALTEGAGEAYEDLSPKIAECWRHVDLPPDDQIMIDHVRVDEAAGSVVTLDTITAVANRIGPMAKGLNRDRLRYLIKGGKVRARGQDPDTGTKFYRLGDVMHAHNDKTKKRRA